MFGLLNTGLQILRAHRRFARHCGDALIDVVERDICHSMIMHVDEYMNT